MSLIQHIHMIRPDPRAPSSRQLWRAWVEMPTSDTGIVATEEGVVGGRYKRVEIGVDGMIDPSPVKHLNHLIAEKRAQGWTPTLISHEVRHDDVQPTRRLFQFHGGSVAEQRQACQAIINALDTIECEQIDWITPEVLSQLKTDTPPPKWEAEVQIGRDRLTLQVGHRSKVVLNGRVPEGSVADQVLIALAAGNTCLRATVCTDTAESVDAPQVLRSWRDRPDWLDELAYKVGALNRPIKMAPIVAPCGASMDPIIF